MRTVDQHSRRGQGQLATSERSRALPNAARDWSRLVLLTVVVCAVVLVTHWPVLSAGALTFDDQHYLTENRLVRNPGWNSLGRFFGEVLSPSTVSGYYQPLTMTSLMLDCALGGSPEQLQPFHRTQLVLHILNTGLVILLIYRLFGQPWAAALTGLLFGVHPLTVEPLAWIAERKTLLATLFALMSLVVYVSYARRPRGWRLGAALGLFALSLLAKPTTTPLPLLLLLLDYWPLRRLRWRTLLEKAPFFVLAGVSAVITFVSQSRAGAIFTSAEHSPLRIPLTLCCSLFFYLHKIVWPVNLTLHNPFPQPFDLSNPSVRASAVIIGLLSAALLVSLRWMRGLLTGSLVFFVAILPTLGVVGFTGLMTSEKYLYWPALGLLLMLAAVLLRLWVVPSSASNATPRRVGVLLVVFLLASLEARGTRLQWVHWRTTEGLYEYMLTLAPDATILHNDLGAELARQGRYTQAIPHYLAALRTTPDVPMTHRNLGAALENVGRPEDAIAEFTAALRYAPRYGEAHLGLGRVLATQRRFPEAEEHLRAAVLLLPESSAACQNLGFALAQQQRLDEAMPYFQKAAELEPGSPEAHNNLGNVWAARGDFRRAAECYALALRLRPDFLDALVNLGSAQRQLGLLEPAASSFRAALQLHPDCVYAYQNLGRILVSQSKLEEARRVYQDGLRIAPQDAELNVGLQEALSTTGPASRP